MARRLTETDKWNDEWFLELKPLEKLVFDYLTDNCDNAGFFELNARLAAFKIGITQDEYLGAAKGLSRGLIQSVDGRKFWLKNFLKIQKNLPLNPENNYHKQIISLIRINEKNFNYDFNYLGAKQGLFSPLVNSNSISNDLGLVEKGVQGENNFETPFLKNHGQSISEFEKELLESEVAKTNRMMFHKITNEKHDEFAKQFILKLKADEHWQGRTDALKYFGNLIPKWIAEEKKGNKITTPPGGHTRRNFDLTVKN